MKNLTRDQQIDALEKDWGADPRWGGICRGYSAATLYDCAARRTLNAPWRDVARKEER